VDAVRDCAAIERGPLVYCLEQADQAVRLDELAVSAGAPLTEHAVTLDGVGATIQVIAVGRPVPATVSGSTVAGTDAPPGLEVPVVAIPYFQWDNRGPGAMRVWIPDPPG
jgi:DUF1680 family protein